MIPPRRLADWLPEYSLRHDVTAETVAFYKRAIDYLERFSGKHYLLDTLDSGVLNAGLLTASDQGKSPDYLRGLKAGVLAVWRDAASAGFCDPPGPVRRIRCPQPIIRVWTVHDLRRLMDTASRLEGCFRSLDLIRGTYWKTLIQTAWDSGLRRRDLHSLRRSDVATKFTWRQRKTKRPVCIQLRTSTIEAIQQWNRSGDDLLWPLFGHPNSFLQAFAKLVQQAGIEPGPFKRIRKSAGTAAEAACPGAGHLLLGNTRAVFERYYLDVTRVLPPRPPELG